MTPPRLAFLYETSEFLAGLREANDMKIWSRVLEKTAAALGAEGAVYFYNDTLAKRLAAFHSIGNAERKGEPVPVPFGEGICGWAAKFGEPLPVPDVSKEDRFRESLDAAPGVKVKSALAVPLFVNLDLDGVFEFFNKSAGPFDEDDVRFAKSVVMQTGLAIRRLKLEEMVNRVTAYNSSILDNLSGGFLALDLQGRVMICNPAAKRILNISGDVTDLPVERALPALPELAAILRKTISSKQTAKRQDLSWQHAGRKRLLGYSTLLIQDTQGAFAGAGVTFQDITNVKK